ncbi:Cytochrome b-c1 complex subunit 7 [Blyttiomyces sp. JEL0837]|nr:Cytochrome b-c1 complex subunit 7 [Blyttiomyces sp. JEL0837]
MSLLQSLRALRTNKAFASLGEWHANQMGYRKMGLKFDDLIPDEGDVVQEALRRLPPREFQERQFRFRRALQLSSTQNILDASEWTKASEDTSYLRPIIEQVEAELVTKQNFDNLTSIPAALKKRNRSS